MIWTTPQDWLEITDKKFSAILDKVPWTRELKPAFQLYFHMTTREPFAAAYKSGRIYCRPDYATETEGHATNPGGNPPDTGPGEAPANGH